MSRGLKSVILFAAFVAIITLSRHAISHTSTTTTQVVTTTSTTSSVTSSTVSTTCQGSDFNGVFVQGEGAAGTISDSVTITKKTAGSCVIDGFPLVALQDNQGALLKSTINDQLPSNQVIQFPNPLANKAPAPLTLNEGSSASFSFAYSDVQTGNTACPTVATMSIQFAAGGSTVTLTPQYALQPCNNATLWVSPFYS